LALHTTFIEKRTAIFVQGQTPYITTNNEDLEHR